ncbi:stress activated MAP kinase interacting protein, putative [Talaromyces stipitatus ATCC 10500]|uniref:Stress activated MAP kinase interacting protein, putative n=1 Tax=Talaromyces stipitatus (strain ATCC 10500 / CBS 375.48 / QM 6759 / NRRL 1006) TaxID=441959 RepID=B8MLH3_TALSN|nr:stress activated MAP kinase interacting protein, putative [Talaromyces stipitatus ATCC 10500]EED15506.1 stress activated MAP kinase interacting protein, putative [Talaromyces stipitatus ATCC 10500]
MSLLQSEDFTIWQLRTSYLSTIKDGIGDRLINVNNSALNTPGFRAAGWVPTSGSATTTTQESGSLVKRTYSPPIPTTANVASEYYRFARHTELNDGDGLSIDDADEDEGGMVTGGGGGSTYALGIKHHGKSARKNRRRDRQVPVIQRVGEGEDEDSSDLSDESDEEGDFTRAAQQIKFSKMPVRNRAGSLPIEDGRDTPEEVPAAGPDTAFDRGFRRSSMGAVEVAQGRPRGDTVTSSDMSEGDNPALFRRRQIQFSSQHQVIEEPADDGEANSEAQSGNTGDQDEDSAGASVDSDLSSDFGVTAGSASLFAGAALNDTLDSSPAMMHKLPNASSQGASPRKAKPATPSLQELPPPRPISTLQPVSLLSKELNARKAVPTNPIERFAPLYAADSNTALNIKIYAPFSEDPETPFNMPIFRESRDQGRTGPVTVAEAIGLALLRYIKEGIKPPIGGSKLNVNRWTLRMVEDGEVDYDFPALGRHLPLADFTSNNNRAVGMRGRSRGKQYDEFALVEATDAEFEENSRLYPKFNPEPVAETNEAASSNPQTPGTTTPQTKAMPSAVRMNPILGQPFSSALNGTTLKPADMPAPTSHATPRLGVQKTLKVRFVNIEGSTQTTTVNTATDSYIAEILDSVCKRWGLDKGNYLLKIQGTNTVAPLDRTVEVLGNISDLDVVRRRFGAGASFAGSPGSASPNAPLQINNPSLAPSKKGKRGHQMLHPLAQPQKQDLVGGYYRRYYVYRKQSMSFTASNQRVLVLDTDYLHVMPGETAKGVFDTTGKTRSINFNDIIGTKVSRRHPKSFQVVVLRGTDAHEQKRYDFEARNEAEAAEIVGEIKKNMEQYRV